MPLLTQMDGPDYPTVHLRAILNEVTKKFRRTTVSVTTEPGPDGNFHTAIEGTTFKRRYRTTRPMVMFEAEVLYADM